MPITRIVTLPEAKAPDPIRQLCDVLIVDWYNFGVPGLLTDLKDSFVTAMRQQRAVARAEAFEEARQIALAASSEPVGQATPTFSSVEDANAHGVYSGTLENGDTFGDEDDGLEWGHTEISDTKPPIDFHSDDFRKARPGDRWPRLEQSLADATAKPPRAAPDVEFEAMIKHLRSKQWAITDEVGRVLIDPIPHQAADALSTMAQRVQEAERQLIDVARSCGHWQEMYARSNSERNKAEAELDRVRRELAGAYEHCAKLVEQRGWWDAASAMRAFDITRHAARAADTDKGGESW